MVVSRAGAPLLKGTGFVFHWVCVKCLQADTPEHFHTTPVNKAELLLIG